MLVKCAGFMGLTIFLIHANFVHSMESVPTDAWGIALSIGVINVGWFLRILHILDKIKSYNGPPSSLTS
jgi:hypothetical protein